MQISDCILYRNLEQLPGGSIPGRMEGIRLFLRSAARAAAVHEPPGQPGKPLPGAGQDASFPGVPDFSGFSEEGSLAACRSAFFGCIGSLLELASEYGFSGNLWQANLTFLLVSHENAYSTALEVGGRASESLSLAAQHDMLVFRELFSMDLSSIGEPLGTRQYRLLLDCPFSDDTRCRLNSVIRKRLLCLTKELAFAESPEAFLAALTGFYREYGVGRFGLNKAFRIAHLPEPSFSANAHPGAGSYGAGFSNAWAGFGSAHPGAWPNTAGFSNTWAGFDGTRPSSRIVPIPNVRRVQFDDLVGYEEAKKQLIDNTEAFVSGRAANNCLLYGEAGTGKSSSIKALLDRFFARGLRIIEITRYDFRDLHRILEEIKNRRYRFILYMDDLSFEENETEYKFLKAVIEGGLEKKPENVLLYATSNRRHLIRENYRDKEDRYQDMHASDTVQEKLSLSARFGLQIYFGSPDKRQYEEIVLALARRCGVTVPEKELLLRANAWELRHGGYSGRTAQQFIDDLLGKSF